MERLCCGRPWIFCNGAATSASHGEARYLIVTLFLRASWSCLSAFPFKGMDDKNATKLNELIQAG